MRPWVIVVLGWGCGAQPQGWLDRGDGAIIGIDTFYDPGCTEPYTGPVLIRSAEVACIGDRIVQADVLADGLTSGGLVFSQETGSDPPHLADEHDLESVDWDRDCGSYDRIRVQLSAGVAPENAVINQSTPFRCDDAPGRPPTHGTEVMTYAFRIYDRSSTMADCLVTGHDPQALVDGTDPRTLVPFAPEELTDCTLATVTY